MQDVKTLRRWMIFKLTPRPNGSVEKQPLAVRGGFASSNDPATWASYEQAREYCVEHPDCSLGFVLGKEVGLVVIDIDKARASKEEPWPEWVEREVEELNSFTETSVSGLGRHIWVWGSIPANRNTQKNHVEIHDSKKMFCVSQEFAEQWDKIQPRDLTELCRRIDEGRIGPKYRKPVVAYAYNEPKFRALMDGRYTEYFADRSAAVASCLCTLANKYEGSIEKMRAEFEASKMCELWADKWPRLADDELEHAVVWWEKNRAQDQHTAIVSLLAESLVGEPATFDPWQYAMKPLAEAKYSGWFPRGRITIVSGSSGAMKTTFLTQVLVYGREGKPFLGHEAGRLPFFMVFADRGKWDVEETFDRMDLQGQIPYECVNGQGAMAALASIARVAKEHTVVVVDGGDLLVKDNNDGSMVGDFTTALQRIAEHYGTAIIVTTGAGKMAAKALKEGAELRTITKGSEVWGRTGGSLFTLQAEGDGTEPVRRLVVLHRNAPREKWLLELLNGRLQPKVEDVELNDAEILLQDKGWLAWDAALETARDRYGLTKASFNTQIKSSKRIEKDRRNDGLFIRLKTSE